MGLASVAARGNAARLPDLLAGLASSHDVMRYWAATGIVILADRAAPARTALIAALKREASPHVRVAIAEALTHVGESALARAEFEAIVASGSESVALQELNAITYIDPAVQPLGAITRWEKDPGYLGRATRYLLRSAGGGFDPSVSLLPQRG